MSRLTSHCFSLFGCLLLLGLSGCGADAEADKETEVTTRSVRSVELDVLIIDDQQLGSVFKRQFGSRRNGVANINEMTWQEFRDGNYQAALENDLLVYPSWRLGEMASRGLLEEITSGNSRLDEGRTRALLVSDRNQAVEWGRKQVAMSLGQSQWVALYRTDVLEKLEMKVPRTWEEFNRLAEQIAQIKGDDLPKRIAFPLQGHWASASLLVRVVAAIRISGKYSSLFNVKTLEPQIDTEPFILSLQAMQKQLAPAEEPLNPKQVLAAYANGELAIAVVPINHHWLSAEGVEKFPPTDLGPIPGWPEVFDPSRDTWNALPQGANVSVPLAGTTGMLVSASSNSEKIRDSIEVMDWMTEKQMSSVLSSESENTGMSRKVHLGNLERWLGDNMDSKNGSAFVDYVNELNASRRIMFLLRIPAADQYLDVLDDAVRKSVLQKFNVVEALAGAAQGWTKINNQLGVASQKSAYRKSVGLDR